MLVKQDKLDNFNISQLRFNLLLQNPSLATYTYAPIINSGFITDILGIPLMLPPPDTHSIHNMNMSMNMPFIFGCFALSVDGKVSYLDSSSGFNIARANKFGLTHEKLADHVYLMLARTIADAIIISKRGSLMQIGNYNLDVHYPELKLARNQQEDKTDHLWAILPCNSLHEINFGNTFFTNPDNHILICTWESQINHYNIPPTFKYYKLSQLQDAIIEPINHAPHNKYIITIDTNLPDLFEKLHSLGLKIILNESPMFHHALLEDHLLNELWLTYSGTYIGGNAPSLGNKCKSFTSTNHPELELLTLHHIGYHFLYSRQKVCYTDLYSYS